MRAKNQCRRYKVELEGGAWHAIILAKPCAIVPAFIGVAIFNASVSHWDVGTIAMVAHRTYGAPRLDGTCDLELVSVHRALGRENFTVKEVPV